MAIEKVEAYKSSQDLKVATTLISQKEGELNALRAALAAADVKALANVAVARAEGRAATNEP